MRILNSLTLGFGVVQLDTSAWKPEMVPQAIVINKNGNKLPEKSGPVPSIKWVTAGILSSGNSITIQTAKPRINPILRKISK